MEKARVAELRLHHRVPRSRRTNDRVEPIRKLGRHQDSEESYPPVGVRANLLPNHLDFGKDKKGTAAVRSFSTITPFDICVVPIPPVFRFRPSSAPAVHGSCR